MYAQLTVIHIVVGGIETSRIIRVFFWYDAAGGVKGHSVPVSGATGGKPAIGSLSAAWPGVIFPTSSRKHTREEATQV